MRNVVASVFGTFWRPRVAALLLETPILFCSLRVCISRWKTKNRTKSTANGDVLTEFRNGPRAFRKLQNTFKCSITLLWFPFFKTALRTNERNFQSRQQHPSEWPWLYNRRNRFGVRRFFDGKAISFGRLPPPRRRRVGGGKNKIPFRWAFRAMETFRDTKHVDSSRDRKRHEILFMFFCTHVCYQRARTVRWSRSLRTYFYFFISPSPVSRFFDLFPSAATGAGRATGCANVSYTNTRVLTSAHSRPYRRSCSRRCPQEHPRSYWAHCWPCPATGVQWLLWRQTRNKIQTATW